MNGRLMVIAAVCVLTACRHSEPPVPMSFTDDPQILRGTWVGAVGAEPAVSLTLQLTASYRSMYNYDVRGTAILGQQAFPVIGQVWATWNHTFIAPQTSVFPQGVRLTIQTGGEDTSITCPFLETGTGQPVWTCWSSTPNTSDFTLTRGTP